MFIDFLLERFHENATNDAIVWKDEAVNYAWLADRVAHWQSYLADHDVGSGTVVALEADFSPNSVALFLAVVEAGCVLVPLTSAVASKRDEFIETAEVEVSISIDRRYP
jgi:long-chain acyl-CoA synthetase